MHAHVAWPTGWHTVRADTLIVVTTVGLGREGVNSCWVTPQAELGREGDVPGLHSLHRADPTPFFFFCPSFQLWCYPPFSVLAIYFLFVPCLASTFSAGEGGPPSLHVAGHCPVLRAEARDVVAEGDYMASGGRLHEWAHLTPVTHGTRVEVTRSSPSPLHMSCPLPASLPEYSCPAGW